MASSRKTVGSKGSHSVTRSEFEDGLLRDNARFDNRLNHQMRGVEKAKRVVVREYDKESHMMKRKMETAAQRKPMSYYNLSTPPANGTGGKTHGVKTNTERNSRLIPDYEYRQYKLKQNGNQTDNDKQTKFDEQPEIQPAQEILPAEDAEVVDGKPAVNGKVRSDDLPEMYVSTRRTKPTEEFWNNLSTPRNYSSVKEVRERLAKEFGSPKSTTSKQRTKGSSVPVVQGTKVARK